MLKTPNKQNNFIIKLAKQVDSNTKEIKKISKSVAEFLNKQYVKEGQLFSIHGDFNRKTTSDDKNFLVKLGQDISQILETKNIKNFEMKYKK